MTARHSCRPRRDERGAIAVLTAVCAVVVLVVAGLSVEIGHVWAKRGQLQVQVDNAAKYAAANLPVKRGNATDERRVAKSVAYYWACHPVAGENGVPACPASPASSTLDTFAQTLLTQGWVSYPTSTSIKVTSPFVETPFAFGRLAGADSVSVRKTAVAKIGSPGEVEPYGLSLNCLLSAAGNLPAGLGNLLSGVLPLNYIAPGPITIDNGGTDWPSTSTQPIDKDITINPLVPATTIQGIGVPAMVITGSGWGSILDLLPSVQVWFANGKGADRVTFSATASVSINVAGLLGTATVAVPSEVISRAGTWKVKVAVKNSSLGPHPTRTWSKTDVDFVVTLPSVTQDLLGCGRTLKSPRELQTGTPDNLLTNLQEGLDHPLTTHPNIANVTLPSPLTPTNLLSTLNGPTGLFQCSNSLPDVKDTGGMLQNGYVPNCVVTEQGVSTYREFTDGMLGVEHVAAANTYTGEPAHLTAGRLVCTSARPCRSDRTLNLVVNGVSRPVNNDLFEDFIVPARSNLLTSSFFFNLSTYLTPGLPVLTPDSALKPEIYGSHRFMWVPVMSSPFAPNDAGSYPILTFRPIFITQSVPAGLGLNGVDLVLDLVDGWVKTALGITPNTDHGIVMSNDGTTLRALRFMTIEPTALPAIPMDYSGPVSDYVGVGPKVVRLVQ